MKKHLLSLPGDTAQNAVKLDFLSGISPETGFFRRRFTGIRYAIRTLALGGIIAISLSSCWGKSKEEKFEDLMSKARAFSAEGKLEEARLSYSSASDLMPEDPKVYFELAEVQVQQQRFELAVENYRAAIDRQPGFFEARLHLATLYLAAREYELAEDLIVKLLEQKPEEPDALLLSAAFEASPKRKQSDRARAIYNRILQKYPNNVGALAGLAGLATREDKYTEAENYLSKALKAEPANPDLRFAIADLYSRQGRFEDAQSEIETLIKENPKSSNLRYGLAEFLLQRGLIAGASDNYEQTLAVDPLRHDARDRLYDLLLVRGDTNRAKALTLELQKVAGENPGVAYFKGRDHEVDGRKDLAIVEYQKALAGLNEFAPLFRHLGLVELDLGHTRQAVEHLRQAIALDSSDVGARLALARLAMLEGKNAEAAEHTEKVLARFPRQLGANILRADLALVEGKTDLARGSYQYLIESYPNNPVGYFKLAILEEKENNSEKAKDYYRKAIALDLASIMPIQRLALLLVAKNGLKTAIEEISKLREQSSNSKPEHELILASLYLSAPESEVPNRIAIAEQLFIKAVEQRPTLIGAYLALAAIDASKGKLEEAVKKYGQLLEKNPQHIPSLMLTAMAYERLRNFPEAEKAYRRILGFAPRFAPAANNLAWLIAEHKPVALDEALELAQTAKEVMPDSGAVSDTLGWVHFKRGSFELAVSSLKEAVELERKESEGKNVNPEIIFHLAQALFAKGEKDAANNVAAQALKQLPEERHPLAVDIKKFLSRQ